MSVHTYRVFSRAVFLMAVALLFGSADLIAQDSFDAAPQRQQLQRPQQPPNTGNDRNDMPPQRNSEPMAQDGGYAQPQGNNPDSGENADFGVPPQSQLRDGDSLHAPTPLSIPGGQVIGTRQLSELLGDAQRNALVFQVHGSQQTLPNAISAGPASQGGSFNDDTQRGFGEFLQRTVGGDMARPLVFYCASNYCWMSYNAALRAINLGYRNVLWYRGGLDAWTHAGLSTQPAF